MVAYRNLESHLLSRLSHSVYRLQVRTQLGEALLLEDGSIVKKAPSDRVDAVNAAFFAVVNQFSFPGLNTPDLHAAVKVSLFKSNAFVSIPLRYSVRPSFKGCKRSSTIRTSNHVLHSLSAFHGETSTSIPSKAVIFH